MGTNTYSPPSPLQKCYESNAPLSNPYLTPKKLFKKNIPQHTLSTTQKNDNFS